MNTLKLVLLAVLCTSVISACSSKENPMDSTATDTPKATEMAQETEHNDNNGSNTVRDAAGNIIDDAGNIVEDAGDAVDDAGKAVNDAAHDVGDAVKK